MRADSKLDPWISTGLGALVLCLFNSGCGDNGSGDGASEDEVGTLDTGATGDSETSGSGSGSTGDTSADTDTDTSDAESSADESETETTGTPDPGFGPWCDPPPACDDPLPPPGAELDWEHFDTNLIVLAGDPNHRIRDSFYVPGEIQWLMGKFAYGIIDKDLKDERVDVYVQRDCAGPWELVAESWTTEEGAHATVEGVEDSGGWVYAALPDDLTLGLGRHRVHMVVRGDQTSTSGFIEVVEPGTPLFLSDIDGTLTTFETEEFVDLLAGVVPDAHPFAAADLSTLQAKGYHAMYLTARPEWLVERSRDFIATRGFPPGIIHTTLSFEGALGGDAEIYKTEEFQRLADKGLVPTYVFGNTDSDGAAYENAGIEPLDNRIFILFDDPHGGRRIESYGDINAEFEALEDLCD